MMKTSSFNVSPINASKEEKIKDSFATTATTITNDTATKERRNCLFICLWLCRLEFLDDKIITKDELKCAEYLRDWILG